MTSLSFDGHDLTLTDGVLACATHGAGCDVDKYTLTPEQRAAVQAKEGATQKQRLAYSFLIENRVRALAKEKGLRLPPGFRVNIDTVDPGRN